MENLNEKKNEMELKFKKKTLLKFDKPVIIKYEKNDAGATNSCHSIHQEEDVVGCELLNTN